MDSASYAVVRPTSPEVAAGNFQTGYHPASIQASAYEVPSLAPTAHYSSIESSPNFKRKQKAGNALTPDNGAPLRDHARPEKWGSPNTPNGAGFQPDHTCGFQGRVLSGAQAYEVPDTTHLGLSGVVKAEANSSSLEHVSLGIVYLWQLLSVNFLLESNNYAIKFLLLC